jgi:hypothetical protein
MKNKLIPSNRIKSLIDKLSKDANLYDSDLLKDKVIYNNSDQKCKYLGFFSII